MTQPEMDYISYPVQQLTGQMTIPGDKSITHRALLLGAIAKGTTIVNGFLASQDCFATMHALQAMGVNIENRANQQLVIQGVGKHGLEPPQQPIDCKNSATTMRLLTGLLAAQPFDTILTGDESLVKRPMARISLPLITMGADIVTNQGKAPVKIMGREKLTGMTYSMPIASAQVKSGLLLAALYAEGKTTIIEPLPTRDHTERLLQHFSYPLIKTDKQITIDSTADCIAASIDVPGDLSSAAFFMVAALITPRAQLVIKNVGINPTRIGIIQILKQMGASIHLANERLYGYEPVADLHIQQTKLRGINIAAELVPLAIDEFPAIFIAAACAEGQTCLTGAEELRHKESDRINAMIIGLQQLGIKVQALPDGLCIEGGILEGGEVDSFDDHRIAMAFAIAGTAAKQPVTIKKCKNVAASFPRFAETACQFGLKIEEYSYAIH